MIDRALLFTRDQLRIFFNQDIGLATDVVVGNIALFETNEADNIEDRLIITLVNIEEESTLKNGRNYQKINGEIRYVSPPVHLNLYLLFTCMYVGGEAQYENALVRLSNVILFFQQKNTFDLSNASQEVSDPENYLDFRLSFELYTLTFEQINHLWGALGGRQLPSVLYKARLVKIDDRRMGKVAPVIEEVKATDSLVAN